MGTVMQGGNPPRPQLAYATVALAAGGFLLGLYAVARPSPMQEKIAGGASTIDSHQVEEAITRLRRDVDALQQGSGPSAGTDPSVLQRLAALEAAVAHGDGDARAAAAPRNAGRPRYKTLRSSVPAVSITQGKDGMFSVTSTDPALTGKPLTIDAVRDDGAVDTYTIVAPAPGAPAPR
jgi:hypothetical protein